MTTVTWIDGTANWNTNADWSSGSVPGANDDAVINSGNVTVTVPIAVGSIALVAQLSFVNIGGTATVARSLTNSGALHVDNAGSEGGSSLTIGGALVNNGATFIGNGAATGSTTVSAASLTNTATLSLGSSDPDLAALLIAGAAGFGTVGVLTGSVFMGRNALLQFGSGQITTIASGASLSLDGPHAHLADASNASANSALTGLSTITGSLSLANGASVAPSAGLTVSGTGALHVDNAGSQGGTVLNLPGALVNNGAALIGNGAATGSTTVSAASLTNAGTLSLASSGTNLAKLVIAGAAGFGTAEVLTGSITMGHDALLQFGSGQITTIASGASLSLDGAQAHVADASDPATSSALAGLASIVGRLALSNGASLAPVGALTVSGDLHLDDAGGQGGTTLSVAAALTNSGLITVGNNTASVATTVTARSIANTGTLNLGGNGTIGASFTVSDAATNSGTLTIGADAALHFGGGFGTYLQAAGTTNVNGLLDAFLDITGGTAEGAGTISGAVFSTGGTILGGPSASTIGHLGVGSYLQENAGTVQADLRGSASSTIDARGAIILQGGTLDIHAIDAAAFAVGHSVTIMTFAPGNLQGAFTHITDGTTSSTGSELIDSAGHIFDVIYDNAAGDIRLKVTVPGADNVSNVSDMNHDGADDVLLQSGATGQVLFAKMVGGAFAGWGVATGVLGAGGDWQAIAAGNVNPGPASGAEVFIQQQSTGSIVYASLDTGATTWGVVSQHLTPSWKLAAVADVNGDTSADAIVQDRGTDAQHPGTGTILYADMHGGTFQGWHVVSANITPDFKAVGAADINGDGFADVVVQQQSTGTILYANMANGAFSGWNAVSANLTADWQVKAVGDVNGDGFADVIVQNAHQNGITLYADLHTGTLQWGVVANAITSDFVVKGVADVDHGGHDEVLFQQASTGTALYAGVNGGGTGVPTWGLVTNTITPDFHVA